LKVSFIHITWKGALIALFVLIFSGCASLSQMKDNLSRFADTKENFFVHTVKWPGETISIVAKWYTGSMDKWKQIAQLNPALDPQKIVIGDQIKISRRLLKTTKPMPEKFVSEFYTIHKTTTQPKKKQEAPTGAPAPWLEPGAPPPAGPAEAPDKTPPTVTPPAPPAKTKPAEPPAASPPPAAASQPSSGSKSAVTPSKTPAVSSPAAPRPASEKTPAGSGDPKQSDEKEPDLFGPKGYSN
jgi:hypothetical protein